MRSATRWRARPRRSTATIERRASGATSSTSALLGARSPAGPRHAWDGASRACSARAPTTIRCAEWSSRPGRSSQRDGCSVPTAGRRRWHVPSVLCLPGSFEVSNRSCSRYWRGVPDSGWLRIVVMADRALMSTPCEDGVHLLALAGDPSLARGSAAARETSYVAGLRHFPTSSRCPHSIRPRGCPRSPSRRRRCCGGTSGGRAARDGRWWATPATSSIRPPPRDRRRDRAGCVRRRRGHRSRPGPGHVRGVAGSRGGRALRVVVRARAVARGAPRRTRLRRARR